MKKFNVSYAVQCTIEYQKEFKSKSKNDLIDDIDKCIEQILSLEASDIQDVDIENVEIINIDEIK